MLQIRLNKGSSLDSGIGAKSLPMETVTVTCPDHLVLADLPVAKGLGSATALSRVKIVGRRSRRQLGERVHFCVRCDFPIAIYGRLSPCEHVFCLDCARSDSICYLCDERIQKIQSVKLMEGIFICAAPHCLKSFLKKNDFEGHIHSNHGDLVQPKARKEEVHESDTGAKQFASSDSLRVAPRPVLQPSSSSQLNDRDDKARRQLPREQTPLQTPMPTKPTSYYGASSSHPSESQHDSRPPGFDGVPPLNHPHQQNFDTQGTTQQVILNEPRREYPQMFSHAPPNLPMPVNSNPPPFGFPPFPSEGLPPFYSVPIPYEVPRPELSTEGGAEQGPLLGYPPGSSGAVGYSEGYPRPWFGGPPNIHFEAMQGGQSTADGSVTSSDHQGRAGYYQGPPPGSNKVEQSQVVNVIDGEGVLVSQPMPPPPPPPGPPPPHLLQQKQGNYFFGDSNHDGKKYGSWQRDKRDSFGSNQDKL